MKDVFMGIDPGQKGGVGILVCDVLGKKTVAHAWRYPGDYSTFADLILDIISEHGPITLCTVEQVHSMPGQGVASSFKFGANFGAVLGVMAALGIPHVLCTPRKWQKALLDAGTGETKARSLSMARRLFPNVDMKYKADDGKADGLHMARWSRRVHEV